jgi:hypothetical protein
MVVKHDGRLNVLCCLLDGGPQSLSQLAGRTGDSLQAVRYWVNLLDSFNLIEERDGLNDEDTLYAATLDEHPAWVREAVRHHRPRTL